MVRVKFILGVRVRVMISVRVDVGVRVRVSVAFLPWRRWNKWLVRNATERYTPSSLEKEFKLAI